MKEANVISVVVFDNTVDPIDFVWTSNRNEAGLLGYKRMQGRTLRWHPLPPTCWERFL